MSGSGLSLPCCQTPWPWVTTLARIRPPPLLTATRRDRAHRRGRIVLVACRGHMSWSRPDSRPAHRPAGQEVHLGSRLRPLLCHFSDMVQFGENHPAPDLGPEIRRDGQCGGGRDRNHLGARIYQRKMTGLRRQMTRHFSAHAASRLRFFCTFSAQFFAHDHS